MKLFAPRNDWNMRSDQSWWGYIGGHMTPSGQRINEDIAMMYSAVFCAVRIISETLASLPCELIEHEDYRTTRKAVDHPLYPLLHDEPNPEQDSMGWFDMQTAFLPQWGNSYSERQRNSTGELVGLWPIHPSRIPLRNITRNGEDPTTWPEIEAGQPGEIVYWVNNDDGSKTPIPASDMLHIPGVLSQNGITGQSIIKWGANSIGVAMATEEHAGAYFRNGAVSNVVIKSPKVVNKDTADRLRHQWQQSFGGVKNHYKTLLLEDGMDAVPLDMNPENSQLILSRQFGVNEIARWFRLPPHMLADLVRSTNNNIEQQSLEFLIYSLAPWLKRWVKALNRQLLSEKEKTRLSFRFDLTELLMGDAAARMAYWQSRFNLGSASPNDVRAAEGDNPVDGGDTYFVQGNNYVPLNMVQKTAQAQLDKLKAPPPAPPQPKALPDESDKTADAVKALLEFEKEQNGLILQSLAKTVTTDQFAEVLLDANKIIVSVSEKAVEIVKILDEQQCAIGDRLLTAIKKTPTADELREENAKLIVERDAAEMNRLAEREIEARKVAAAAKNCLLLSIQATVEGWMGYESRAAKRAAEKPQTFLAWRDEFYPEFQTKLSAALLPFAEAAEPIGFTFDASVAAGAYVAQSVSALESIADVPCSELVSSLNAVSDTWADRPKRFAAELLKGGAA